jgi:hypothetical protein
VIVADAVGVVEGEAVADEAAVGDGTAIGVVGLGIGVDVGTGGADAVGLTV